MTTNKLNITITVHTSIATPRPTTTGVRDGIDYDAELVIIDEVGETRRWSGELTYAPGRDGALVPYGGQLDHWVSDSLLRALRTPWIAAHKALVDQIVESLSTGPGREMFKVKL
jgi:hypothetical protein